jgi:hypothetical protein
VTLTGHARLLAYDPDLTPLWQSIHDRLCAGESPTSIATVRVTALSRAGVAALRSALDTTVRRRRGLSAVNVTAGTSLVPLRELIEALQIPAHMLPALVEHAVGVPIVDRSSAQRAKAARKEDLWAYATRRLPAVPGLLARMRAAGIGIGSTEIRRLVDALATVLPSLPLKPPVTLAKLAHDTAGDPVRVRTSSPRETRPSAGEKYSNRYSNAVRTSGHRDEPRRTPQCADLHKLVERRCW